MKKLLDALGPRTLGLTKPAQMHLLDPITASAAVQGGNSVPQADWQGNLVLITLGRGLALYLSTPAHCIDPRRLLGDCVASSAGPFVVADGGSRGSRPFPLARADGRCHISRGWTRRRCPPPASRPMTTTGARGAPTPPRDVPSVRSCTVRQPVKRAWCARVVAR